MAALRLSDRDWQKELAGIHYTISMGHSLESDGCREMYRAQNTRAILPDGLGQKK